MGSTAAQPYMWIDSGGTSMSAITVADRAAHSESMSVSSSSRSSMRSSPRSTANDSSPMCLRARSTACPRPFGSPCRTKWMSASAFEWFTRSSLAWSPFCESVSSSSVTRSKWLASAFLLRPMIIRMSSSPDATASSTTYWIAGLSTTGSISFGIALVAGRKRVPSPAAGMTAFVIRPVSSFPMSGCYPPGVTGGFRAGVVQGTAQCRPFRTPPLSSR